MTDNRPRRAALVACVALAGALAGPLAGTGSATSGTSAPPGDPLFPQQWGLLNNQAGGVDANVLPGWALTTGDAGVLVAVVDSGVDPGHPDIAPNLRADLSRNFVADAEGAVDARAWADPGSHSSQAPGGHGTHVAGILAAARDNGVGISGLAPRVGVVAIRVCGTGSGCGPAAVADGLRHAGASGARVANVSLSGPRTAAITAAMADHPQTLYVVAAGNQARDLDSHATGPGSICATPLPNVLCVGAIIRTGARAAYSNLGARTVDLAAPGGQPAAPGSGVISTMVPARGERWGHSFASLEGWVPDPPDAWSLLDGDPPNPPAVRALGGPAQATLEPDDGLDLSDARACRLTHRVAIDAAEQGAGATRLDVEASVAGGPWEPLRSFPDPARGDPLPAVPAPEDPESEDPPPEGPLRTSVSDVPLIDAAGQVRLRLRTVAPEGPSGAPGFRFRIASLAVDCLEPQPGEGIYRELSGTSMAVPHVAGAAALLAAHRPGASTATLRAALLGSVRRLPELLCTTVSGGTLDVAAAMSFSGPAPGPPCPAPPPAPPSEPVAPVPEPIAPAPIAPAPIGPSRPVPARPVAPARPAVVGALGTVDRLGRVRVRVRCIAARPCAATVVLRARTLGTRGPLVVIARRPVRLGAGRTAGVMLTLNRRGRVIVSRSRALRVQVRSRPVRGGAAVRPALLRAPVPLGPRARLR